MGRPSTSARILSSLPVSDSVYLVFVILSTTFFSITSEESGQQQILLVSGGYQAMKEEE